MLNLIPLPSFRPNPSSICDSKGRCVYMDVFFPPHPRCICGMMPSMIHPCGITFLGKKIYKEFLVMCIAPVVYSVCSLCEKHCAVFSASSPNEFALFYLYFFSSLSCLSIQLSRVLHNPDPFQALASRRTEVTNEHLSLSSHVTSSYAAFCTSIRLDSVLLVRHVPTLKVLIFGAYFRSVRFLMWLQDCTRVMVAQVAADARNQNAWKESFHPPPPPPQKRRKKKTSNGAYQDCTLTWCVKCSSVGAELVVYLSGGISIFFWPGDVGVGRINWQCNPTVQENPQEILYLFIFFCINKLDVWPFFKKGHK